MRSFVRQVLILGIAVAIGSLVEVTWGARTRDVMTSRDVPADARIVVVDVEADATVLPELGVPNFEGWTYNSLTSLATLAGARAVGLVEFDSLAFGDSAAGRALVIGSEPIQRFAVIPVLEVALDDDVDGIPLLSDYRIDLLASEVAGIGLPVIAAPVVRTIPALGRASSIESGAIVHVPNNEVSVAAAGAAAVMPGFAFRLVELATGRTLMGASSTAVTIGDERVPLEDGALRIRWSDQLDDGDDAAVVSYAELVGSDDIDRTIFRDAIVLIGTTDPALTSLFETPAGSLPAILIHANAVNTLLAGQYVAPGPPVVPVVGAAVAGLAIVPLRRSRWRVSAAVTLSGAWLAFAYVAAGRGTLFAPLLVPVIALVAALLCEATQQVQALAERRQLRSLFSQYVPASIADQLVGSERGAAAREGERVTITVLFCDLRGFTPLAGRLEPSKVRLLLNTYYEEMGTVAFTAGGTIMQYTGDEIFVVFGAPLPVADHAGAAIKCARSMFEHLDHLNATLNDHDTPPINFGIGIHSGEVVAAHVGSSFRMQYSVIGDTVNVASRHVSTARAGQILISDATIVLAGPQDDAARVLVQLKGVVGERSAHLIQAGPSVECGSVSQSSRVRPVEHHLH